MALQFQRNAKVYLEMARGSSNFQIPVLAGFSFSQSMNSSEVTVNEAGTASRRARLLFNDSLAPVEWSMSTYIRPTLATSGLITTVAPEQALWALLMGADGYDSTTKTFYSSAVGLGSPSPANSPLASPSPFQSPAGSPDKPNFSFINYATSLSNTFDFTASNVSSFPEGNKLYLAFEDGTNKEYFTLSDVVVNSVTIDFDIEGIATAQWSGFSRKVERSTTLSLSNTITTGLTDTTNFIRNRISTISLGKTSSPSQASYNIVLTGGSFTVENNISYLIPEQLGTVNKPIANITGSRSISGSLTCYYDNSVSSFASADLWADMISPATEVRNVFNLTVNIGGATSNTPRLQLQLPTAHLEIPTIGVDDLLTLEVNFHGQVSNGDVDLTNEAAIVYLA
jgi:hypothetical protein